MKVRNNKLDKLVGPYFSFTGYVLIAAGIITISYSLTSLILIIPGMFIAFTFSGTIIDTEKKRVKPYTSLSGIIKTGKWINVSRFTGFNIIKSTRKYISYSRTNLRFDLNISDLRLLLINKEGTMKVILNKYNKWEDAQKEMDELKGFF